MNEVLERERKWEVDDDFVLPSLDDIVPGGEVEHSTIELTSAYFDTADRDLSAHGLLLRRREGDDDAGWQLKMPDSNGRIEIRYPLSDTMPSDLSALLTGVSLGKQLVNVATIHTTRKRSRITDPKNHQLVAEIASTTYARPSTGEHENRSGGARSKSNPVPPPMRCRASSPNAWRLPVPNRRATPRSWPASPQCHRPKTVPRTPGRPKKCWGSTCPPRLSRSSPVTWD
jgi:hypothetical protein